MASLKRNTNSTFVGLTTLKCKQTKQLAEFERWTAHRDWQDFPNNHYDWWMFPINEMSQHGAMYVVYRGDIAELKQDQAYIQSYLRGVELLALSWGWNLAARTYVPQPQPGQAWNDGPAIRLYKAARSLQLFGYTDAFDSLKAFALDLLRKGVSFKYGDDDLARLFTEGRPRR